MKSKKKQLEEERWYSCQLKKTYKSLAAANQEVARLRIILRVNRPHRIRAYKCQFCKGYHITTRQ